MEKLQRTYKCNCNEPNWNLHDFHTTKLGDKYVLLLHCVNCNSVWETRVMTDQIFSMLSEEQKSAYFNVLKTQNRNAERDVDEIKQQINSLEAICTNAESQIQKNNELIKHFQELT